jgi:hypothetical protein
MNKIIFESIIDALSTKLKYPFEIRIIEESLQVIEIHDINNSNLVLCFACWPDSNRLSIFTENREIFDQEILDIDHLIKEVDILLSHKIIKEEIYREQDLVAFEYKYSFLIKNKS